MERCLGAGCSNFLQVATPTSTAFSDNGLTPGTTYRYKVRAADAVPNFSGYSNIATATTATSDTTPPTVTLTSPVNGVTGVATGTAVTATFSEPLAPATVNTSTFELRNASSALVPATISYNANTATLTPTSPLAGSATYTATVKGGAADPRVKDVAGNALAANHTWSFTTAAGSQLTGLIGAYSFNEGVGSIAGDASGNSHTGTVTGATWTTSGKYGGTLNFDGTNDLVTVADSAALDLTTGMTLSAWVHPTALSTWRTVLLKERSGGLVYALYASDQASHPNTYITIGGSEFESTGPTALPLNVWNNLAATYDGSALRVYINGVQVSSRPVAGSLLSSTGALRIGGNSVWGEYFQGLIDEVRIYSRVLTAAEIQTDMNTPVGVRLRHRHRPRRAGLRSVSGRIRLS